MLYECLTGVVPYPKPSDAAVMYAHLSEPPPLVTEQRPDLPPNLDEVICKAMDKDPASRHPSASALIDDAEKALGKRVRAVITPPGPIEGPEEAGIREREARVPTRPERLREPPAPDTTPGVEAPAVAAPAWPRCATAAARPLPRDGRPAGRAPRSRAPASPRRRRRHRRRPRGGAGGPIAEPASPTVATPAVAPDDPVAEPASPTMASPAVDAPRARLPTFEPEEATGSPPTVAMPSVGRGRRQPDVVPAPAVAGTPPPALPVPDRAPARDRSSRFPSDRGGRDRRGRADRLPDRRAR